MRTRLKYTLSFLFGAAYFWALTTVINPNYSNGDFIAGFLAGIILIAGSFFILVGVIAFIQELWSMDN